MDKREIIQNEEEFQKKKKEIIADISENINEGETFIYMGRGKDHTVLLVGGTFPELALLVAKAMDKSEEIEHIIKIALEAFDKTTKKFDDVERFEKIKSKSDIDTFEKVIVEFKKANNCEACEKKDTCEIYNYSGNGLNEGSPLDIMEKMIKEMGMKPKGTSEEEIL